MKFSFRNILTLFAAVVCALTSSLAFGRTAEIDGASFTYDVPAGYCSLKESAAGREMFGILASHQPPNSRLIDAMVWCRDFQAQREASRYITVAVLMRRGTFGKVTRQYFLDRMSSVPMSKAELSPSEIRDVLRDVLGPGYNIQTSGMVPIGRDGNALYMASQMSYSEPGKQSAPINMVSALTYVNSTAIQIYAYTNRGVDDLSGEMIPSLKTVLRSFLTKN